MFIFDDNDQFTLEEPFQMCELDWPDEDKKAGKLWRVRPERLGVTSLEVYHKVLPRSVKMWVVLTYWTDDELPFAKFDGHKHPSLMPQQCTLNQENMAGQIILPKMMTSMIPAHLLDKGYTYWGRIEVEDYEARLANELITKTQKGKLFQFDSERIKQLKKLRGNSF
jgi:hypothetical protein